jgi:large subunit ribosomal protein LP1
MSANAITGTSTSTNKPETAVSYAALILADANIAITPEKLQALLAAANVEDVEPIWTTLVTKALESKDVKDILTTVSTSGPEVETFQPKSWNGKDVEGDGEKEGEAIVEGDGDESDMEGGMFDLFG